MHLVCSLPVCDAGYQGFAPNCEKCPVDTFNPTPGGTCENCPGGSTTGGTTGSTDCQQRGEEIPHKNTHTQTTEIHNVSMVRSCSAGQRQLNGSSNFHVNTVIPPSSLQCSRERTQCTKRAQKSSLSGGHHNSLHL